MSSASYLLAAFNIANGFVENKLFKKMLDLKNDKSFQRFFFYLQRKILYYRHGEVLEQATQTEDFKDSLKD